MKTLRDVGSVELRLVTEHGDPCDCGQVKPIGHQWVCVTELACDWGVFTNPEANPHARAGIQHLVLASPAYVTELLDGPRLGPHGGGIRSAFVRDGRVFVRLDWQGNSWTWEMFEAHWWDDDEQRAKGTPNTPILVGRWSD